MLNEWHPFKNKDKTPSNTLFSSGNDIWWYLPYDDPVTRKHFDFEWQTKPYNLIKTKGTGCPYLDTAQNPKLWVGYNDFETWCLCNNRQDLLEQWHPTKNGLLKPNQFTKCSTKEKIWWYLSYDDSFTGKHFDFEWQTTIANRYEGKDCPYICDPPRKLYIGFNDLETRNPTIAQQWHPTKNKKPAKEYFSKSNDKVWWLCENGHEWQAKISDRNKERGTGCPYCSGSKTEKLVYIILKSNQIVFKPEYIFKHDFRVAFYPYDCWLPYEKLLIELDGEQHFTDKKEYFETNIPFEERCKRDNIKNQFCLDNHIQLLRIPWVYHPEKDKSKIETLVLNFIETRNIPQEIIDYYEQYDFSNYSKMAKEMNKF